MADDQLSLWKQISQTQVWTRFEYIIWRFAAHCFKIVLAECLSAEKGVTSYIMQVLNDQIHQFNQEYCSNDFWIPIYEEEKLYVNNNVKKISITKGPGA